MDVGATNASAPTLPAGGGQVTPAIATGSQTLIVSQLLSLLVDLLRQRGGTTGGGPTDAVAGGQLANSSTGPLDPGLATSLGGNTERGWSVGTPLSNFEMVDTALGGQAIIGGGPAAGTGSGWNPGVVTLGGSTDKGWSVGTPT